jgi:hypothetical protein
MNTSAMEFLKPDFKEAIETRCKESSGGVKMNFFELLQTSYGFEALQAWFFSQSGSEIDEYGLWKILKMICEKVTETVSWEIFDTLAQDTTMSFKEFCMIIFLFAAAETGELKLMLYMYGKKFYQLLSGGERQDICFERTKRIGRILGMNEKYLIQKGRELSLSTPKVALNFEQFQLYYFKIFCEVHIPEIILEKPEQENAPKPERNIELPPIAPKKKSSCTGCKSKACNLL